MILMTTTHQQRLQGRGPTIVQIIFTILLLLLWNVIDCYEIYDPNDQMADESVTIETNQLSTTEKQQVPIIEFDCTNKSEGYYGDHNYCDMFHYCKVDGKHFTFVCPVGNFFDPKSIACELQQKSNNDDDEFCQFIDRSQLSIKSDDSIENSTTLTPWTNHSYALDDNFESESNNVSISRNSYSPSPQTTINSNPESPMTTALSDYLDTQKSMGQLFPSSESNELIQPLQIPPIEKLLELQQILQAASNSPNEMTTDDQTRFNSIPSSIQRFIRNSMPQSPVDYIRLLPRFLRQLQSSLSNSIFKSNMNRDLNSDENMSSDENKRSSLVPGLSTLSIPVLIPINLTRDDYRQNIAYSQLRPTIIALKDQDQLVPAYVLHFDNNHRNHRLNKRSSFHQSIDAEKKPNFGSKKLLPRFALRTNLLAHLLPSLLRNRLTKSISKQKESELADISANKINADSSMLMPAIASNNAWPVSIYGPWWAPESYAYIQHQLLKAASESSNNYDVSNAVSLLPYNYRKASSNQLVKHPAPKQLLKVIKSMKSTHKNETNHNYMAVNRKSKMSMVPQQQQSNISPTMATNVNVYVPDELFDEFPPSTNNKDRRNENKDSTAISIPPNHSNGTHGTHRISNKKKMAPIDEHRANQLMNESNENISHSNGSFSHNNKSSPSQDRFQSTVSASMMVARSTNNNNNTDMSTKWNRTRYKSNDDDHNNKNVAGIRQKRGISEIEKIRIELN